MSKHSPGPWFVHEDDEEQTMTVQFEAMPSYYIPLWGKLFSDQPPSDTDRANAHLIAAAPDMLEALEAAYDWHEAYGDPRLETDRDLVETLGAAITKARGEANEP